MTLLFVLWELEFGGVERQAELLAEEARRRGLRVEIVVLGGDGPSRPRLERASDRLEVLGLRARRSLALARAIAARLRGRRYEGTLLFGTAKLAALARGLSRVAPRIVVHVGNPVPLDPRSELLARLRGALLPARPVVTLAANSAHTAASLARSGWFRRFPRLISWNVVRAPFTPNTIREECLPLRVGMAARLDPIKDQSTLLRATAELLARGVPVELLLAGEGSEGDRLRAQARAFREHVQFLGRVEDIDAFLARLDVFVFATTAREGFGNAAAEAMASGLPCILTDVGPCREVGGDATLYFPVHDARALACALGQIAEDASLRRELAAKGRARAMAHFSPARKLDDLLPFLLGALK